MSTAQRGSALMGTFPEDRCVLAADCNAPMETTLIGWAGGMGWVFDACWFHAKQTIDIMSGWALTSDVSAETVEDPCPECYPDRPDARIRYRCREHNIWTDREDDLRLTRHSA